MTDLFVAIAHLQLDHVMSMLAEAVQLTIVGRNDVVGRDHVATALLSDAKRVGVREFVLENVLSHGKSCAANGVWLYEDGRRSAFCSIYTFDGHGKSAKVLNVQLYVIDVA